LKTEPQFEGQSLTAKRDSALFFLPSSSILVSSFTGSINSDGNPET
jgi:hypothetical protein